MLLRRTKVFSPLLDEHYIIAENTLLIEGATCPIDKTALALIRKGDYRCVSCGAFYTSLDPITLHNEATSYLNNIASHTATNHFSESSRLEKILNVAKTNRIISDTPY